MDQQQYVGCNRGQYNWCDHRSNTGFRYNYLFSRCWLFGTTTSVASFWCSVGLPLLVFPTAILPLQLPLRVLISTGQPSNNIVYFGATKATVSGASTTSLTLTVPTGAVYSPVSVDNISCALTAYSQYPFLPTYDNSDFTIAGSVNFSTKVDFTTSSNPYGVAIGDIDGDGKSDVVAVNLSSNTISVFRNTSSSGSISSGSFSTKVDFHGRYRSLWFGAGRCERRW